MRKLRKSTSVTDYLFFDLYSFLSTEAKKVLHALLVISKIFLSPPTIELLAELTELELPFLLKILNRLETTSLINNKKDDENLYDIHELTQVFLEKSDSEMNNELKHKPEKYLKYNHYLTQTRTRHARLMSCIKIHNFSLKVQIGNF